MFDAYLFSTVEKRYNEGISLKRISGGSGRQAGIKVPTFWSFFQQSLKFFFFTKKPKILGKVFKLVLFTSCSSPGARSMSSLDLDLMNVPPDLTNSVSQSNLADSDSLAIKLSPDSNGNPFPKAELIDNSQFESSVYTDSINRVAKLTRKPVISDSLEPLSDKVIYCLVPTFWSFFQQSPKFFFLLKNPKYWVKFSNWSCLPLVAGKQDQFENFTSILGFLIDHWLTIKILVQFKEFQTELNDNKYHNPKGYSSSIILIEKLFVQKLQLEKNRYSFNIIQINIDKAVVKEPISSKTESTAGSKHTRKHLSGPCSKVISKYGIPTLSRLIKIIQTNGLVKRKSQIKNADEIDIDTPKQFQQDTPKQFQQEKTPDFGKHVQFYKSRKPKLEQKKQPIRSI
ncbi:hypothetical protein LXL04_029956 [Taraxacum kok-saghyz]